MNDIDSLFEKAMADAAFDGTLLSFDVMSGALEGIPDALIEKAMADAALFDTLIPFDVMTMVLEGADEAISREDELRRFALRMIMAAVPEARALAMAW